MLNIMWKLDTEDDYFEWYYSLDEELQAEADILQRMMILESFEEDLGNLTEAKDALANIMAK
jgi:hypothetical protein